MALTADTIFFGGGTPSLLDAEEVAPSDRAPVATRLPSRPSAEVTLEANPETVSVAKIAGYRSAGVNRISLGVQSLHDRELRRLDRQHSAARARQALDGRPCGGHRQHQPRSDAVAAAAAARGRGRRQSMA